VQGTRGPAGALGGGVPSKLFWPQPTPNNGFSNSRVIVASQNLRHGRVCPQLLWEFQRLCPGGTATGARVVCDVTARVFDGIGGVEVQARRFARATEDITTFAKECGFGCCDVFDLAAPSLDVSAYRNAVREADVYYVDVGNTWALMHFLRLHNAHADPLGVAGRVRRGELLYVGCSAGGIVAGRSIVTATWKDWDDKWEWQQAVPTHLRTDWNDPATHDGLDILGGSSFFPHLSPKYQQLCAEKSQTLGHNVLTCSDSAGFVIEGGQPRLIE